MKERPIIFSAPMVRAILDGRKKQTRRVVKLTDSGRVKEPGSPRNWHLDDPEAVLACPYGVPGDRLIVRESGWERPARTPKMLREGADTWARYYYDADGLSEQESANFKAWGFKRRPSIHMPRWASRITLEIVSVRVERVQDISEEDALAEGVESDDYLDRQEHFDSVAPPGSSGRPHPVTEFARLWDSINAKRAPWSSNPWVWVIEFRRVGE